MVYYTYNECKEYLSKFNIRSSYEFYRMYSRGSFNELVNKRPYEYYKKRNINTWISWSDFLSIKENKILENKYLQFNEAREYVRTLNIKNQKEWIMHHREKSLSRLKIPSNPNIIYRNEGWVSLSDWLGINSYKNKTMIKYLKYIDCKSYIKKNFPEVKNRSDWYNIDKSEIPMEVPKRPDHIYKKSGDWINWESFLESPISPKSKSKLFLNFYEARKFVRELKFTQMCEYLNYLEKGEISFLPKRPSYVYRKNWNGFLDFLGCEPIKKSYGEKKIAEYLDNHKIIYEREKKFDSCKNVNSLKFDFYIPKLNLCIEYDGELHYKKSEMFGGEKTYNRIIENDKIKNNWCLKNGLKIIRISYKKKRTIDKILDTIFNN